MTTQTQTRSNALHWFITIVAIILLGGAEFIIGYQIIVKRYVDDKVGDVDKVINTKVDARVETYLKDNIDPKLDSLLEISNKLLKIED